LLTQGLIVTIGASPRSVYWSFTYSLSVLDY